MIDFVVYVPPKYSRHSAGFRALYKFADELDAMGYSVALSRLDGNLLGLPGYVPINAQTKFPFIDELNTFDWMKAVHLMPEIVVGNPFGVPNVARWFGNKPLRPIAETELLFQWKDSLVPGAQRLCVDLIEKEFFYPKAQGWKGQGTLYYQGKGTSHRAGNVTVIDHEWPVDRKQLGRELRLADFLISSDNYTLLNIESAICGTPIIMSPGTPKPDEPLFGVYGIAMSSSDDECSHARYTVQYAADHYDKVVRPEIKDDVAKFVESCKAYFG